jgi:soluble lytic murein transglycosylase-like protein
VQPNLLLIMERLVHMAALMTMVLSGGATSACWDAAARVYGVDPWLLYGIAKVESSL